MKRIKKKLSSGFLVAILVLLFTYLGYQLFEVYQKNKLINKEMDALEKEIVMLEENILDLNSNIEYLESDLFIEEEGRTKLGLAKEGEQVVIITKKDKLDSIEENTNQQKNWLTWWEYFFE